ncbi:MAG: hypothetical protein QOJ98_1351 [Acidobacteriota bacterium]|jgi:ubiquinone/menaquinone biosynthesis C-methylase UbiE|nr:hypothetical protein [Acidobacteriota bacterium]
MNPDVHRLRDYYATRLGSQEIARRSSLSDPAALFSRQRRARVALSLLTRHGVTDLSSLRLLEIGCGSGDVAAEYYSHGARPSNIHGLDILATRAAEAGERVPGGRFLCADGASLPYRDQGFDLVMQYTALSSILSPEWRRDVAAEMLRVLRPDGLILWYDFLWNPLNKQTVGLRKKDLLELFPGCELEFRRVTLIPPIARRLVRVSWWLAETLENLRLFNSHYFVAIHKRGGQESPSRA